MFCSVYPKKKKNQEFQVFFRNTDLAHILIDEKFVVPSWNYNSEKSPNQLTNKKNQPQGTADALAGTEAT